MTTIKIARATAWLLLFAAVFLTLGPRAIRPDIGVERHLEHFLAFTTLGLAFATGYPKRRLTLAFVGIAGALLLETFQLWAPGRHANVSDFAMNAIGMCAGVAFVAVVDRLRRALQRRPQPALVSERADLAAAAACPVHPPTARR